MKKGSTMSLSMRRFGLTVLWCRRSGLGCQGFGRMGVGGPWVLGIRLEGF